MSDLLEIRKLCFYYHKKRILYDISFTMKKGEVLAIIGPSGAGKSTLLRAVAMLTPPTKGEVIFRGRTIFSSSNSIRKQDFLDYKGSVGMVFQELYLWPHLTVMQNITLPLVQGKGVKEDQARGKAEAILDKLSLTGFANQYPNKLSVGQQQRCAIARTLAMDPEILLLDEITSALDPELVGSILELIKDIATDPGRTLLVVTHEMEFAKKVSHRIGYIDGGNLIALGTPAELSAPDIDPRISRYLK
jgi:polar amino acid transport system ATP-binding protein